MSMDTLVAILQIPEMPPGQPAPVTLAFRPFTVPMTAAGTTPRAISDPADGDLLRSTVTRRDRHHGQRSNSPQDPRLPADPGPGSL